ncbi:acetyltransferase [Weeksellaceae bacterium KMM 9713]|uniref:Acetyltransferase n=1 Tax=Profundicola chukchiensis TaxID=2961959 RepID=A0A9X4RX95_9FLAO|nr:acetyltransferase [Profundicola chukchiensis]MDG4946647.1 acetyltransferase [Profundicola chukchiensis]
MLIVGAKGMAQEILDILHNQNKTKDLVFFDDININDPDLLFDKFPIFRSISEVEEYFKNTDQKFSLGIGLPVPRKKFSNQFESLGGVLTKVISNSAIIGNYNTDIEAGVNIALNACISSSVHIKKGSFINAGCLIGHDTNIGEFSVICPSCNIGGYCDIGDLSFIGTGSIIYPNVKIGKNVSIAAGSIVRKNIPDNAIVHGNDGKVIKIKPAINC